MSNSENPWRPGVLRDHGDFDDLLYVVVEEEIDDTIGLVVSDWPLGGNGPPRFPDDADEFELAAERDALREHLAEREVDIAAAAAPENGRPSPPPRP